jgi:hypothetical protein
MDSDGVGELLQYESQCVHPNPLYLEPSHHQRHHRLSHQGVILFQRGNNPFVLFAVPKKDSLFAATPRYLSLPIPPYFLTDSTLQVLKGVNKGTTPKCAKLYGKDENNTKGDCFYLIGNF